MEVGNKNSNKHSVHKVLAHSYTVYFVLLLIGISLDLIFQFKIFQSSAMIPIGLLFIIFATIIILWAQKTGRDLRKVEEIKTEHFCRGPYCYTRVPTQWGLFLLMLGFGIIANAPFVILSTVVSFIISKLVFIKKHDKILTDKYGDVYSEYKKLVKF